MYPKRIEFAMKYITSKFLDTHGKLGILCLGRFAQEPAVVSFYISVKINPVRLLIQSN